MQAAANAPDLFFAPRGGRFGGGPPGRLSFEGGQGRYRRAVTGYATLKRHGRGQIQGHAHAQSHVHGGCPAFDHSHAGSFFVALNGHYCAQGSGPSPDYDYNHNYNHHHNHHNRGSDVGPGPGHGSGSGGSSASGRAGARRGRGGGRGRRGANGGGQGHARGHGAYINGPSSQHQRPSSSHSSAGSPRSRHSSQSGRSTPSPLLPPLQQQLPPPVAATPAMPASPAVSAASSPVHNVLEPQSQHLSQHLPQPQHSRPAGDGRRRGRIAGAQPRAVAPCQLKQLPPPPPTATPTLPAPPLPPSSPPSPPPSPPPPSSSSSSSSPSPSAQSSPVQRIANHGPPPVSAPALIPVHYSYVSTVVRYEKSFSPQRAHNVGKKYVSNEHLAEDCMAEMEKCGSFYYSTNNIAQMKQWPHSWQPHVRKPWRMEKYPPRLFQGSEWDEVSRDIWDKYFRNKQKQTSYDKKVNICRTLSSVLEPVHPGYLFLVTGSTLNGFGTERSDLDICLLVDDSNATSRDEALAHLERIKHTLNDDPSMTKHAELIMAKVPILKFRDARWDVEVDINCNSNVAIRNTHLLYCYSICDWRVRPLVTIVKLWAARHRINDAKNMTISSYSLVLMVIHFLQCGVSPAVLPCLGQLYPDMFSWQRHVLEIDVHQPPSKYFQSMNNQPLGKLLLDFLQYYLHFDYSRYALSVRLGTRIPIEECRLAQELNNGVRQKPLLCIEEPFERTNTAYAVHNPEVFGRILAVFRNSYTELKKTKHLSSIFKHVPQLSVY